MINNFNIVVVKNYLSTATVDINTNTIYIDHSCYYSKYRDCVIAHEIGHTLDFRSRYYKHFIENDMKCIDLEYYADEYAANTGHLDALLELLQLYMHVQPSY